MTDENMASRSPSSSRRKDWIERLARHRTGLAALSFAESTVVPIPLEIVVAPLMVGHPKRSISIALAIWVGCLVGASLFYVIGAALADPVVLPILAWLGLEQDFHDLVGRIDEGGLFWTVLLVSFSPAPMQLATLGSGVANGNFAVFFAAIALSRGVRYFGLAIVAQFAGERIAHINIPKRKLALIVFGVLGLAWVIMQVI